MNTHTHILSRIIKYLAQLTVRRFSPIIVAVTGSVGKTSTKEAIYAVLAGHMLARKSPGNLNNELGVPLAIIGGYEQIEKPAFWFWLRVMAHGVWQLIFVHKETFPEVLVLEYAADKPGDISYLLSIAKPHVGVISAIGSIPVHAEQYPTGTEGVIREKGKLVLALGAADTAVINADDVSVKTLLSKIRARTIVFGQSHGATVRITHISHVTTDNKIEGLTFKLENESTSLPVFLPNVFSVAHASAVAAGVCVGQVFDINAIDALQAIEASYAPIGGRSAILEGMKDTQIIDESYNSSPLALEVALQSLTSVYGPRKIAVLGDMLELGPYTIQAHKDAGALAARCVDVLITVGSRARIMAQEALDKGMSANAVHVCETAQDGLEMLQKVFRKGDAILIKGSHSIGLDSVVREMTKVEK
ncbi:MAG: UDP-N-acetylmuramoyl-tripeptide--D-alanyl-D-alanine ligase [Candidatus Paceibacterota bacterium]|jgi:UDP-N-acetylmuramoyl-tripeptide--D-alanyl-D-alanine ligase